MMIELSVKELFIFLPSFSAHHIFVRFFPFLPDFILLVFGDSELQKEMLSAVEKQRFTFELTFLLFS